MIAKSRIFITIAAAAVMTLSLVALVAQTNQTAKLAAITVSCKADPDKITKDMEAPVVTVTATAEQKEENQLTYTWSATAGANVSGYDSVATIDAAELKPGLYIIRVKVDDDKKNSAVGRCSFSVAPGVAPPKKDGPADCPPVALTATPQSIEPGASADVTLHATSVAPEGQKITYKWSIDKGELKGEGETVTLNTASVSSGEIKVTVTASDGKCGDRTGTVVITKK